MKKLLLIITICALALTGCGKATTSSSGSKATATAKTTSSPAATPAATAWAVPGDDEVTAVVEMEMESGNTVTIGLFADYAPATVENFLSLVKEGFYDGLTFHRVISGFMVQGGDPEGTGMGGSDKEIKGEFKGNGFAKNTIAHDRGVISMARSQLPDSASSQFFIVHKSSPHLNGQYAAFGKVLSGIEVIDEIAAVETDASDKPSTPVVIKKMTVKEEK